jgi:ligand-binding sensor domain-containing protein
MTKTIFYTIFLYGCLCNTIAYTQQPAYTYYTIRDGLPSNDIYNCIEDKKGFLWIATENGLAKFDGKNFKIYTSAQGLPDNEILAVDADSAGVIWVMPFQRNPAYYDERSDRFINSKKDPELKKITLASVNYTHPLSGGGMAFCNSNGGIFIYQNGKCTEIILPADLKFLRSGSHIIQLSKNDFISVSADSVRFFKNRRYSGAQYLGRKTYRTAYVNNNIYLADSVKLVKIPFSAEGKPGKATENILPFEIATLNFTGNQIAISSSNGNIYLADTATLNISRQAFSFNALIRYLYEDKAGNTWICTKETGLIRYQQKGILTIGEAAFQRNFNTLSFFKNQLIAGTNDGRLLYYSGAYNYLEKILPSQKSYSNWVRRIVPYKDKLYVASEGPVYVLEKNNIAQLTLRFVANKDIFLVNDSLMLLGNTGFVKSINPLTNRIIDSQKIRVTKLCASSPENIFVGSNNGLYKWNGKKEMHYYGNEFSILNNRVSALSYNKEDKILWVGLATDSFVAMQNDRVLGIIPLGIQLPGNITRAIYCSQKNMVWIGTNKALARIKYRVEKSLLKYSITVFTTSDGIAGKQINDIAERNDTMYVATTGGISIIPATLNYITRNIPVYISGIKFNYSDTILQHEYDLPWKLNNISLSYTATDLAATTERIYQYRINSNSWITTQNENLELQQLAPGKYILQIRALKRNGVPSAVYAELIFTLATPFWKSTWFYFLITVISIAALFYFFQKRNKKKREQTIQKLLTEKRLQELELKALKAQINPHFVFNCLNSIKFLNHKKRFAETEKYLDKFSYLLRRTLDFSGLHNISLKDEIAYSKNYLELETLRLGEKMSYEIKTDPCINTEEIMVPPMLFQPYLENAVKHGIRYLNNQKGKISILLHKENQMIICSISDNGIGIENSVLLNKKINPGHISYGNTLQERRAILYGIDVEIKQNTATTGTEVILKLKDVQS